MYSDKQAWANSVDPDETPQNVKTVCYSLGFKLFSIHQAFFKHNIG